MHNLSPSDALGTELNWQSGNVTSPPKMQANELHLWYVPLELDPSIEPLAISLLNDTQRDKYHRRSGVPGLQKTYLAGRYFLTQLLAAYANVKTSELLLSYSKLNKPYLNPNPNDIHFNFSDTNLNGRNVALFAFSQQREIGVDIEFLARRSGFDPIVRKRFGPTETEYVRNQDGTVDAERFLACWTRKEAYGKAIGQGINFKMRDMDLASPGQHQLMFLSSDEPSHPYRLEQIEIDNELIAAVVIADHEPIEIKPFVFNVESL